MLRARPIVRAVAHGRSSAPLGIALRHVASRPAPVLGGRLQLPAVPSKGARPFSDEAEIEEKEPEYQGGDLTGYETFNSGPYKCTPGGELPELTIAYETWGDLNARKDNVILLQCGMSASSHAASNAANTDPGWWEDYIGPGAPIDTNLFFVVCSNNLGGCFGSSGPMKIDPRTGKPYGSTFPRFSVQDMVHTQFLLMDHLGIKKLHACVGASLGGMLALASAAMYPERVGKFVSISGCAKSFPGSMAFRHAQRQAVMLDPHWNGGDYYDGELPADGLRLARQIGTITYRSGQEWRQRFSQRRRMEAAPAGLSNEFEIEEYLAHQGEKWVNNYDPNSMLWISKAMDSFTLEQPDKDGKPNLVTGLSTAKQPALVIGVQHDVLFPVWQQKEISDTLRLAGNKLVTYYELDSVYGHDAFLLEATAIGPAVKGHLENEPGGALHLWKDMAASSARILQAAVSRSNSADNMRDIFRTLAEGSKTVDRARLRSVVKLVFDKRVKASEVDRIFAEHFSKEKEVRLQDFLKIRTDLQLSETTEDFSI